MFKTDDLDLIDSQLLNFVQENLLGKTENLRQLVLDSPTQQQILLKYDLTRLILKTRKQRDFITLCIVSWYLPEEIRFLLQMEISQSWRTSSDGVKEVLLTSKDFALTWLMRISKWNENDFFGNFLNEQFVRKFNSIGFKKISQKKVPRYTGYCRGYQDTNRGVPSSTRDRKFWATSSVEEEEQRRLSQEIKLFQLLQRVEEEFLELLQVREMKYF